METVSKFARAIENQVDDSFEVAAPEMFLPDFDQIRQNILDRYSHPIEPITPTELLEHGYQQISTANGEMYTGDVDTVSFAPDGHVAEHWHWPEGKGVPHISFAVYDRDGYVTVEEERIFNPDKSIKNSTISSKGSHHTTIEYEESTDGKVPVTLKYRDMLVTSTLHTTERMWYNKINVIDLKAQPSHQESEHKSKHRHFPHIKRD